MPARSVDTLIIGGGQAGLTMSHRLKQRGREHLVLERKRVAERWRSERWDGLKFQFPNWSVRLPEFPFPHADPDGFADVGDIVAFIEAYAAFVDPPIQCGLEVKRLRCGAGGFVAETSNGSVKARNVVVATGPYQYPKPAPLFDQLDVFKVHASRYQNPAQLPDGAVLVVGAGASGAQIAEELLSAGRKVFLSVGRHNRLPRRYRGHDLMHWLAEMKIDQRPTAERGPVRLLPVISGAYGGHTIDFRRFAAQGMMLLGRVSSIADGVIDIAPDLSKSLATGDQYFAAFLDIADAFIKQHGLDLPEDAAARVKLPEPACVSAAVRRLDLRAENIHAVVLATGYGLDLGWIDIPVLNATGEPIHQNGITAVPGLYFLGLQWLSKMSSSFLSGVGEDAAVLADHIATRS